ncbi:hypothetical protein [Winogradskyella endarachnes]|uniref:Uncharacterized protein n=1 Tax=Winogradskyella endarachnes TaxID=2681965 RepID=A0A6L6UAP3_9FLAO|nr:hypothetical protein [Winogradskyella endarachnes]MUU78596.1 hypothetical protein [Winogradskyella endarachnes]
MKNLRLTQIFIFSLLMLSCSSDDSGGSNEPLNENPGINATIDGGTYNNYTYTDGIYEITYSETNSTMSINAADTTGDQITLFLNSTGGFSSDTVKIMGDTDSNNYRTYVLIRQASTQKSYYSTSGNVTITENRNHPTESGIRLVSGTFDISASTTDNSDSTTFIGSFTELEYEN